MGNKWTPLILEGLESCGKRQAIRMGQMKGGDDEPTNVHAGMHGSTPRVFSSTLLLAPLPTPAYNAIPFPDKNVHRFRAKFMVSSDLVASCTKIIAPTNNRGEFQGRFHSILLPKLEIEIMLCDRHLIRFRFSSSR